MIDVNGTRYHLLLGRESWLQCDTEDEKRRWEYDGRRQVAHLQAEIYAFKQQGAAATTLTPAARRGAARDSYGHWYWIGADETEIWARWSAASQPELLFPRETVGGDGAAKQDGSFAPAQAPAAGTPERLTGLAVTADAYLVVGAPDTGSLLVFDLYALDGGFLRVPLPRPPDAPHEPTAPFDMAALPDGGLLILDREHKLVWHLDSALQTVPATPVESGDPLTFQPQRGRQRRQAVRAAATPIELCPDPGTDDRCVADPLSVAPLPDGTFWVLDDRGAGNASWLWRVEIETGTLGQPLPLTTVNLVETGADDLDLALIRGHDLAYVPAAGGATQGTLFVADVAGNQAFALTVDLSEGLRLGIDRAYYPLRSFTGTALVAVAARGEAYYHQGSRWLPIKALPQQRFEEEATLILPVYDGRDPGCVWHRLCLDACIPPETEVLVATRAADTEADLAWAAWQAQPPLYQRGGGSEIPYSDLWGAEARATADTGTWELLLQAARGRYLQIRLTLRGNGRSTPLLRALRAHYPRYSYLREYLPAVYQQDAGSQQFVENFLANPEGIFTTVEGLIAQVQTLMDVRTVPAEAVTWLASWLGLALEPGWSDYQRRLLLAHAPAFFQRRGTLPGLLQAILLTVYPQLGPDIFRDDVDLRCTTIRIVERFLTRTQPAVSAGDPTEPAPTGGDDVVAEAAARAHRFTVMLPTEIDSSTQHLVERIVALEKPAHTSFTVKQYWALFRVGEVRLGLDTVLGRGGRFETFRLGETALAEGTLGAAFPYSLTTRTVIAR